MSTAHPAIDGWLHDRAHIRMLQHAHADHIESLYASLAGLPGNPSGVASESIAGVRTFIANENRLENRAIFNGDETAEQIDEALRHFVRHNANCVIEINPANSYVDPPRSWEHRLLPHLLRRGCTVHGMRCVWHCGCESTRPELDTSLQTRRFTAPDLDDYLALARLVEPGETWSASDLAEMSGKGRHFYLTSDGEVPCAVGSLFVDGSIAYLSWWYTHPAHRGRGAQQEGIRRRLADAFALGCTSAFTVTDVNFASPHNLQKCGFVLAYNYLLVRRDPVPFD